MESMCSWATNSSVALQVTVLYTWKKKEMIPLCFIYQRCFVLQWALRALFFQPRTYEQSATQS